MPLSKRRSARFSLSSSSNDSSSNGSSSDDDDDDDDGLLLASTATATATAKAKKRRASRPFEDESSSSSSSSDDDASLFFSSPKRTTAKKTVPSATLKRTASTEEKDDDNDDDDDDDSVATAELTRRLVASRQKAERIAAGGRISRDGGGDDDDAKETNSANLSQRRREGQDHSKNNDEPKSPSEKDDSDSDDDDDDDSLLSLKFLQNTKEKDGGDDGASSVDTAELNRRLCRFAAAKKDQHLSAVAAAAAPPPGLPTSIDLAIVPSTKPSIAQNHPPRQHRRQPEKNNDGGGGGGDDDSSVKFALPDPSDSSSSCSSSCEEEDGAAEVPTNQQKLPDPVSSSKGPPRASCFNSVSDNNACVMNGMSNHVTNSASASASANANANAKNHSCSSNNNGSVNPYSKTAKHHHASSLQQEGAHLNVPYGYYTNSSRVDVKQQQQQPPTGSYCLSSANPPAVTTTTTTTTTTTNAQVQSSFASEPEVDAYGFDLTVKLEREAQRKQQQQQKSKTDHFSQQQKKQQAFERPTDSQLQEQKDLNRLAAFAYGFDEESTNEPQQMRTQQKRSFPKHHWNRASQSAWDGPQPQPQPQRSSSFAATAHMKPAAVVNPHVLVHAGQPEVVDLCGDDDDKNCFGVDDVAPCRHDHHNLQSHLDEGMGRLTADNIQKVQEQLHSENMEAQFEAQIRKQQSFTDDYPEQQEQHLQRDHPNGFINYDLSSRPPQHFHQPPYPHQQQEQYPSNAAEAWGRDDNGVFWEENGPPLSAPPQVGRKPMEFYDNSLADQADPDTQHPRYYYNGDPKSFDWSNAQYSSGDHPNHQQYDNSDGFNRNQQRQTATAIIRNQFTSDTGVPAVERSRRRIRDPKARPKLRREPPRLAPAPFSSTRAANKNGLRSRSTLNSNNNSNHKGAATNNNFNQWNSWNNAPSRAPQQRNDLMGGSGVGAGSYQLGGGGVEKLAAAAAARKEDTVVVVQDRTVVAIQRGKKGKQRRRKAASGSVRGKGREPRYNKHGLPYRKFRKQTAAKSTSTNWSGNTDDPNLAHVGGAEMNF